MIILRGWFLLTFLLSTWLLTPGLYISTPMRDSTIAGVVEVVGSVPVAGFQHAELSYAYQNNSSTTWFQITRMDRVIQDGVLGQWDTTTITDGTYRLKLRVLYQDGREEEVVVDGLMVANYSHEIDTTPDPMITITTPTPVNGVQITEYPTPLPPNPAMLKSIQVKNSLITGVITGIILMAVLGIIYYLSSISTGK